jgi:sec-independent protein translocase protein TatB
MFDIGWQELILIGIVALVAIGPKDLPAAMRTLARLVSRGRAMSREFQSGVAEVMREAELDELRRKVDRAGRLDLGAVVKDQIDPTGTLTADFDPADFARRLKEEVEAGPPVRRPDPGTPDPGTPDPGTPDPGTPETAAAPAPAPSPPATHQPDRPPATGGGDATR